MQHCRFLGAAAFDIGLTRGGGRAPVTHRGARLRDHCAGRPAARAVGRAPRARRAARHAAHRHARPGQSAPRKGLRRLVARVRASLTPRPCRVSSGSSRSTRASSSAAKRRSPSATRGPAQRLVLLAIDAADADVTGFEPVWVGRTKDRLRYLRRLRPSRQAEPGACLRRAVDRRASFVPLTVHVVGERRARHGSSPSRLTTRRA